MLLYLVPFCIAQESEILETRSARASLGSHFTPQQPTRPYEEERTKTEDASTAIFSAEKIGARKIVPVSGDAAGLEVFRFSEVFVCQAVGINCNAGYPSRGHGSRQKC